MKEVLGEIDLDPASCEIANEVVGAKTYFSKDNSGLSQEWKGKIFLNPPYERKLIGSFVHKLVTEYELGNVEEAIILTHNCTDSRWFHTLANKSPAICLVIRRVKFWSPGVTKDCPSRGQVICYLGKISTSRRIT